MNSRRVFRMLALTTIAACQTSVRDPQLSISSEPHQAVQSSGDQSPTTYTSSRLNYQEMEALVSTLLPLIERTDFDEADRQFERLVVETSHDHGEESSEVADLIMAYGMVLYHEAEKLTIRERALAAMWRAVGVYKIALGPGHPEVALSLSDFAHGWWAIRPEDPPMEAEAAFEESYRIRLAAFGPHNLETASALLTLGSLKGLPSRTGGEPRRIEAAARLIRQSIRDFGLNRIQPDLVGSVTARLDLATMYLENGLAEKALHSAGEALDDYRRNFSGDTGMCGRVATRTGILVLELLAAGHNGLATRLDQARSGLGCFPRH